MRSAFWSAALLRRFGHLRVLQSSYEALGTYTLDAVSVFSRMEIVCFLSV